MESSSVRSSAPESQVISRRTLVRAGATAAWTVPIVQVVGAAPALATTNAPSVSWTQSEGHYRSNSASIIDLTLTAANHGGSTTKGSTVTIVLPMEAGSYSDLAGASFVSGSGTTWTFKPNAELVMGGTCTILVSFAVGSGAGGDGSVTWTATNAEPAAATGVVSIQLSPAAKTTLAWQSLTGSYASTDATFLDVNASVKNTGSVPATDFAVKITLPMPASLATTPTSGWNVAPVGTGGTDWSVTKNSTPGPTSLAAGAVADVALRFTVASTAGGSVKAVTSATDVSPLPAHSTSTDVTAAIATLGLPSFTANYVSGDPTKLSVTANVSNGGTGATKDLKFTLTIPANKYNLQPSSTTPSGWNPPTISPATGTGPWTLVYTPLSPIPATSGSLAFVATITVDDTDSVAKTAASTLALGRKVEASNGAPLTPADYSVTALPDSVLSIVGGGGTGPYSTSDTNNKGTKTTTLNAAVLNPGPKVVGSVLLTVNTGTDATAVSTSGAAWTYRSALSTARSLVFEYTGTLSTGGSSSYTSNVLAKFTTQGSPTLTISASGKNGKTA